MISSATISLALLDDRFLARRYLFSFSAELNDSNMPERRSRAPEQQE
jgi:hypothetical protein